MSGLVERLRRQAVGSSQASKIIAESKAGDYEWALPEQTLEAEAAALIEQLVEALEESLGTLSLCTPSPAVPANFNRKHVAIERGRALIFKSRSAS